MSLERRSDGPTQEATRRHFDGLASGKGAARWRGNVDKWEAVRPLLDSVPSGGRALECGAGTGMYTSRVLAHGLDVTAVDLSPAALEVNRRIAEADGLSGRLHTMAGPFEQIAGRFVDAFDAVLYFKTLHHFPDRASVGEALRVGYRALKPGGVLIGLEPNGECPFWRPGLLLRGNPPGSADSVWRMEQGLLWITAPNLERVFASLPGARWQIHWEYVIPAFVARRLPRVCGAVNRLLDRTPLRRRAFNLTFRVEKGSGGTGGLADAEAAGRS